MLFVIFIGIHSLIVVHDVFLRVAYFLITTLRFMQLNLVSHDAQFIRFGLNWWINVQLRALKANMAQLNTVLLLILWPRIHQILSYCQRITLVPRLDLKVFIEINCLLFFELVRWINLLGWFWVISLFMLPFVCLNYVDLHVLVDDDFWFCTPHAVFVGWFNFLGIVRRWPRIGCSYDALEVLIAILGHGRSMSVHPFPAILMQHYGFIL